jgi:hypothetical protein
MLKPVHVAATLFLASAAVLLSGACSNPPEDTARVAEPVQADACLTACDLVAMGRCDWESQCDEDYGGAGVGSHDTLCGGKFLSCDAAEHAANGEAWGVSYCWRRCEGLD